MSEPNLFGLKAKAPRAKAAPAPDGVVHRLLMLWVGLFQQRFGEKPMVTPADGATLKRLVKERGESAVAARLEQYLALDDAYLRGEGFPLKLLPATWNKLVAQNAPAAGGNRVPDSDRTDAYLRSLRRR